MSFRATAEVLGNNQAATAKVASEVPSAHLPGQLPPSPYGHLSGGPFLIALTRPLSQPAMATSRTPSFPPHRNAQEHQQRQLGLPVPPGVRPPPLNIATAHHPDGDIDPDSAPASLATARKRAAPIEIDVENANQSHLGVCAPDTARPLAGEAAGGGSSELICLCTKAPKVPRPRNAFILYRQHYQASVAAEHPGLANPEISKLIGEKWREQPEELKNRWKRLAEEEKARHQRQYPDYRYQPRRGGKNAQAGGNNHKPASGAGEDPGRCAKCGGRYIATPRTPSTPFVAAPPPLAVQVPGDAGGMPPYLTPNPRVIETDHIMRRGSSASNMSVDSHGRRHTGPASMREIDEDYTLMSVRSPTHPETAAAKRRRINGSSAYLPGSPPAAYTQHPGLDSRYYYQPQRAQQGRQLSLGAVGAAPPPQYSAGGRASTGGPLPRPSSGAGGAIAQLPYRTSISGMQPPPRRPSISYPASAAAQVRTGGAFDESLRLPPLQTQMSSPPSPPSAVEYGARVGGAQSGIPTGPGAVQNGQLPPHHPMAARQPPAPQQIQQEQHAHSQPLPTPPPRYQFLLKLEMLRAISPPLKPAGAGVLSFETRGPLIAVEGEPGVAPHLLKATASVVEAALRISDECVVKVWHGNAGEGAVLNAGGEDGGGARDKDHSSPLAEYVGEMLRWHRTSEELVKYMTTDPAPDPVGGEEAEAPPRPPRRKLPVAVVGSGYALTQSDHFASALRVADAYRPDDHWRWVATLWRGIVGPDLTIYVRLCRAAEIWTDHGDKSVEFANPGVMVLRVSAADLASSSSSRAASIGAGSGRPPAEDYTPQVDEKLERRLGFEIMEWVRSHAVSTVGNRA